MTDQFTVGRHPILRKLESIFALTDAERDGVLRLPMQITYIRADQDIVREGDRPTRSCAVLEGFTCTSKIAGNGKRQIVAFHIPGDIPDVQSLHLDVLDTSLGTITPTKVGFIQHEALRTCFEPIRASVTPSGARRSLTRRSSGNGSSTPDGATRKRDWRISFAKCSCA